MGLTTSTTTPTPTVSTGPTTSVSRISCTTVMSSPVIETTTPGPVVTTTTPFVKTTTTPVKPIGGTSTGGVPKTSTGTIKETTSPVVVVSITRSPGPNTPGSKTTGVTWAAGPGKTSTPTTKTTKTPSGGVIKSTATPATCIYSSKTSTSFSSKSKTVTPSTFSKSTISPTPSVTTSVSTITPSVCPACIHKGKYYQIGDKWTDDKKCVNYSCVAIDNPCVKSNLSAQIEASKPMCAPCPKGFKAQVNKDKCCPECIPTDDVDDICKVKNHGTQTLVRDTADKGRCVSLKPHKITGCDGICGSKVRARLGMDTFVPECNCCQPKNVRRFNVAMKCSNGEKITAKFYEILSCVCELTRCDSTFGMNRIVRDSTPQMSFKQSMEALPDTDDDIAKRRRRQLLNDLALVHAQKKRK